MKFNLSLCLMVTFLLIVFGITLPEFDGSSLQLFIVLDVSLFIGILLGVKW